MPSLTTTQTTEVKISPALKKKLLLKLKTYASIKVLVEVQLRGLDIIKEEIEELFIQAGEFEALQAGVKVDGYSTKHISGVNSRLDKRKLLEQGVSMAQLENAMVTKPSKPYVKISVPGERDKGGEE